MKNKEFLERASKLQKEFAEIYKESGLVAVDSDKIHVTAKLFHELEKENLLEHVSKVLETEKRSKKSEYNKEESRWHYEAMTLQGVKIIAIKYVRDKR